MTNTAVRRARREGRVLSYKGSESRRTMYYPAYHAARLHLDLD